MNENPTLMLWPQYRDALLALGRTPKSLKKVESDFRKLAHYLGKAPIATLSPQRLRDFQLWLIKTPMASPRKKRMRLSAAARAHICASLRTFLRWCYKTGTVPADLSAHLVIPKLPDTLPRDLPTLKEVATLIRSQRARATPRGLRNAAVLSLLFAAGLRKGELVALDVGDLNLQEREVRVKAGKGGGRIVPIAAWAGDVLLDYLQHARPQLLKGAVTERLFLGIGGEVLQENGVDWVFKTACHDAKLRPINPHAFRHAFCVQLLRNGASIRVVSALAGHKTLNATVRYTRLNVDDLKEVVRKSHPRGR